MNGTKTSREQTGAMAAVAWEAAAERAQEEIDALEASERAAEGDDCPQEDAPYLAAGPASSAAEPFCACGRRWSDCDGSRAKCHRRTKTTERAPGAREE